MVSCSVCITPLCLMLWAPGDTFSSLPQIWPLASLSSLDYLFFWVHLRWRVVRAGASPALSVLNTQGLLLTFSIGSYQPPLTWRTAQAIPLALSFLQTEHWCPRARLPLYSPKRSLALSFLLLSDLGTLTLYPEFWKWSISFFNYTLRFR